VPLCSLNSTRILWALIVNRLGTYEMVNLSYHGKFGMPMASQAMLSPASRRACWWRLASASRFPKSIGCGDNVHPMAAGRRTE
jgi:hypothetical protein